MLHIMHRHEDLLVEADDLRILGQGRCIVRRAFQCRDLSLLNTSSGVKITHKVCVLARARVHTQVGDDARQSKRLQRWGAAFAAQAALEMVRDALYARRETKMRARPC